VPFQHASAAHPETYEAPGERREGARAHPRLARICPDITIRSTFMRGFPGETEAEFSSF